MNAAITTADKLYVMTNTRKSVQTMKIVSRFWQEHKIKASKFSLRSSLSFIVTSSNIRETWPYESSVITNSHSLLKYVTEKPDFLLEIEANMALTSSSMLISPEFITEIWNY